MKCKKICPDGFIYANGKCAIVHNSNSDTSDSSRSDTDKNSNILCPKFKRLFHGKCIDLSSLYTDSDSSSDSHICGFHYHWDFRKRRCIDDSIFTTNPNWGSSSSQSSSV
mmetsp:Transcript_29222/g.26608  ORF Transcript_29222/g.26608 Transcript_29222/m.26608 type:complete len:110 (-) Transcript_29222:1423-1752(-)